MSLLGNIGPYDEGSEDWRQYRDRLDQFFIANNIEGADRRRAVFLSVCGRKTFQLVASLLAPAKPGDTDFEEICEKLQVHLSPTPPEILQRFHFYRRSRQQSESVAEFLADLRRLAATCNFGDHLDEMLRDRLVLGINEDRTQRLLLSESKLTLQKALKVAQSVEAAVKGCITVAGPSDSANGAVLAVRVEKPLSGSSKSGRRCFRCLSTNHVSSKCPFANKSCFKCSKIGHTANACRSKSAATANVEQVVTTGEEADEESCHSLYHLQSQTAKVPPLVIPLLLNETPVMMELDTGASVSLISQQTHRKLSAVLPELQESSMHLKGYGGQPVEVLGEMSVSVKLQGGDSKQLPLVVVAGTGSSLIGRNWLKQLPIDLHEILQVRQGQHPSITRLLDEYQDVFSDGLGHYTGDPVSFHRRASFEPKFFKARQVPFALKAKVEAQLSKEIEQGILKPVASSDFASPIVPVLKSDGSVRICADFKRSVNLAVEPDTYPLPRIEELFAKLTGGKQFTKLDLSQAYMQLPLDEKAQEMCTINTSKGLLRYTRLPFGVSPAVGIFQRTIDCLLQGIEHAAAFIDDVIITGKTEASHLANLQAVLQRLQRAGLKCRLDKCDFMRDSVDYLGHRIDASGLHPLQEKVKAITAAPVPQNQTQLRSYLGLINYYAKFLPNLASVVAPLHRLLEKSKTWNWDPAQQKAFEESKQLLLKSKALVHFDNNMEVTLECDSSQYGLGAVICHKIDGIDRPIAFASRTLSSAEINYSQTEKEALALIFGIKRFHPYLYGRTFQLLTDHKPLVGLLREDKPIPAMASGRIQRWALLLSCYSYRLQYRQGASLLRADALSRLPLPDSPTRTQPLAEVVLLMDCLDEGPVTAAQVKNWTRRDPLLSRVMDFVLNGWPAVADTDLRPFASRAAELSVEDGCLLWGSRVVVPAAGRPALLSCFHQSHAGASRMKALARSYVWWPGMDEQIEETAAACTQCRMTQSAPAAAPLQPWPWPDKPWSRVHMDFAGPVDGRMLLVLVDAHSKWLEVHVCKSTTTAATINKLRRTFSQLGLPDILVSDNGPNLVSAEMRAFTEGNGIRHIRVAPYHPASNGLAERAVRTVKEALKKSSEGSLEKRLARFLLTYRVTPHATTGVPPCQLLMGRQLTTAIDRIRPDVAGRVQRNQERQKQEHDSRSRQREFKEDERVFVRDFGGPTKWTP
ncbi:MAG: RNase H-like domain-containing protein, partial [Kangiellaceae bacterium]|nr:RNase H-like domain-containing protein [Kangiellaceae bacterium]